MALIRTPRSQFWWIDIAVPAEIQAAVGKDRIRESTGTTDKKAAQRLHDERKASLWRQHKLGEKPDATLADAVKRWEKRATTRGLRNVDDVAKQLEWWQEVLGKNTLLRDISRQDVMRAVEGKMTIPKSPGEKPRPASPARINRYLATMRTLLRLAAGEWEMIDTAPVLTLLPEPKGRIRALTMDEIERLVKALPDYLVDPFLFSLATGLRQSNVLGLQWAQVDLVKARLLVASEDFKSGDDFGLPLNATALAILTRNHGKHKEAVFTIMGHPLTHIAHKVWKAALQRAGVQDFRWHDVRHSWATMQLEAGTDLDTLQKLGGWKSREMVTRYAHFRTEHLRGPASAIDKVLGGVAGTNPQITPIGTAHLRHTGGS
jgi:integrase